MKENILSEEYKRLAILKESWKTLYDLMNSMDNIKDKCVINYIDNALSEIDGAVEVMKHNINAKR